MIRWFGKGLCILAALAVVDAHMMLVQGWAWGTMLQDRAPERGMSGALDSTFSGAEPCPMCCAVQEERHEEQEEAPVPEANPTVKWIPAVVAECKLCIPGVLYYQARYHEPAWILSVKNYDPEVPPPQFVA